MKKLMIIILALIGSILADDIYLKTGKMIKNVQIISTEENWIVIKTSDGKSMNVILDNILKIIKSDFNPLIKTEMVDYDKTNLNEVEQFQFDILKGQTRKIRPYKILWPITILCWGLSYDYFKTASDLRKINKYVKSSRLETSKNRCTIYGVSLVGMGILNLYFTFKTVDVKVINNQLYLSYNF